jgi:hypothetical protein
LPGDPAGQRDRLLRVPIIDVFAGARKLMRQYYLVFCNGYKGHCGSPRRETAQVQKPGQRKGSQKVKTLESNFNPTSIQLQSNFNQIQPISINREQT